MNGTLKGQVQVVAAHTSVTKSAFMNDQHIQWASKHNWYVGHGVNSNNQVFIRAKVWVKGALTGTTSQRTMDFTNIDTLKRYMGDV